MIVIIKVIVVVIVIVLIYRAPPLTGLLKSNDTRDNQINVK